MNTITITIELCAEDRARLDKILEALTTPPAATLAESLEPARVTLDIAKGKVAPVKKPEPVKQEETPTKEPEPTPETPALEEKPKVTREAVQRLVQKLAAPTTGKREAVRAIVKKYAEKVGDIPEDKLGEVMESLVELEGAQ